MPSKLHFAEIILCERSSSPDTSIFVEGNGFLKVNDFYNYDLPEPIMYEGNNTYSIAVFHQLHCLVFNLLLVWLSQTSHNCI